MSDAENPPSVKKSNSSTVNKRKRNSKEKSSDDALKPKTTTESSNPTNSAEKPPDRSETAGGSSYPSVLERYGYSLADVLGKGSYAVVKKAYSTRHRRDVAIKIITKRKAPEDFLTKFLPREIRVLKCIRHAHVTNLLEVIETNTRINIITDLADKGDLLEYIRKKGALSENIGRKMFQQIVRGIYYCHENGIVHRDLKCENVLLDKEMNIIISDFGFARDHMVDDDGKMKLSQTFCGSYAYAPPEILKGIAYDPTYSDIWSMGVILYTILCGRLPFDDSNLKVLLQQVHRKVNFPAKVKLTDPVKSLIHRILEWNVQERATLEVIQADPWYQASQKSP